MLYIKRNEKGEIVAASKSMDKGFDESIAVDSDEINQFFSRKRTDRDDFHKTDLDFIRVLDDLIGLLVTKNIIRFTDLPNTARQKMQQRQYLREVFHSRLDLIIDQDDKHSLL